MEVESNDRFEKVAHRSKRENFEHEYFDQYYKEMRVDGAGYIFHYENGEMYYANGNYVKVGDINIIPSIITEEAIGSFLKYKAIEKDKVSSVITDLFIKELVEVHNGDTTATAHLVYSVYLDSDHPNNDEVGYIEAHTGLVVGTTSRLRDLVGSFDTRYSGIRQANTAPVAGGHRLFDNTRGAPIHTKNLQNNTTVIGNAVELIDIDNNWTAAEHAGNNDDMGLDVHWALQEIYDYFIAEHGINSFDDDGEPIRAFIRYGNNQPSRDNAFWNQTLDVLLFGQGEDTFDPLASLDVVAHEYGHGIADFQVGWGNTFDQVAFEEGLSDIWAAIIEYEINPNQVWRAGEQVAKNYPYIRNFEDPEDPNARTRMADTYQNSIYNNATFVHERGGIFSHWFYLLVNGGSGTNDNNDHYSISGVGMDRGADLIVEAVFNGYQTGTTTYPAIRTSMITAAEAIFCENSPTVKAVTDAWYAVGVGPEYSGSLMTVDGPILVCITPDDFTLSNVPSGVNATWSSSTNLSIVSGQGNDTASFKAFSKFANGAGWIRATLDAGCGEEILEDYDVWVGKSSAPDDMSYDLLTEVPSEICTSLTYGDFYSYLPYAADEVFWETDAGTLVYTSGTTQTVQWTQDGSYYIRARGSNNCGFGPWITRYFDLEISPNCGGFGGFAMVYPNPTSTELNIEKVYEESEPIQVEIYNSVNLLKLQETLSTSTVDVSSWEPGIYIVKMKLGKRTQTERIIVE